MGYYEDMLPVENFAAYASFTYCQYHFVDRYTKEANTGGIIMKDEFYQLAISQRKDLFKRTS